MDKLVAQFPKQITDALDLASKSSFPSLQNKQFKNVIICGMGGSGIGGRMIIQLFNNHCSIPVILIQDYDIPSFVNEDTLCILSSYSGDTEETISASKLAFEKNATIIGISSGGYLIKFLQNKNCDFVKLPGGNPPRSMIAFSFIQLVNILTEAKLMDKTALEELKACRNFLNNELITIKKEAEKLAQNFYHKQGIIYTDSSLEFVAIRARQQLNENSKQLVWHHVLPEMNHNELVGWEGESNENYSVVFLESKFLSNRMQQRINLTEEIISKKNSNLLKIKGVGNNKMEEAFYFIHIIDWASLFLATLNQVDSIEVKSINYLKSELSKLK